LAYRYLCLTASYRKPLTWSEDAIQGALNSYRKLKNVCLGLESSEGVNQEYLDEFQERINDDLDMPGALAVIWKLVRDDSAKSKVGTIRKMDEVFGLKLLEGGKIEVPEEILKLVKERQKARGEKDFGKSDLLRNEILEKGFVVRDGEDGFRLEKKEK